MRHVLPIALLAAACGGKASGSVGPPTGQSGRAVKTVCEAGKALLLRDLKLECSPFPVSPESNSTFWRSGKPCGVTIEEDGFGSTMKKFDYQNPHNAFGGTFNAAGNLATIDLLMVVGLAGKIIYEYDGSGLLVGAHMDAVDIPAVEYVYKYENGVRVSEGIQTSTGYETLWFYVYEGGRLTAEGPPVAPENSPPSRYPESNLEPGPDGQLALVPDLSMDQVNQGLVSTASNTYFYDTKGELMIQGFGATPGARYKRLDYTYDGSGRLSTVALKKSDNPLPQFGPQTWTYAYDCPN